MAGYGHYDGESAVAIGFSYHAGEDVMFNVGTTLCAGKPEVNAGVTFKFGRGKKDTASIPKAYQNQGVISSVYTLQHENVKLNDQVVTLQNQVLELQEQIKLLLNKK
jgi:hypothetical protein